ncbi:hypothetical protein [Paraburkholderia sp. MM5477-R1]|uniref:hypothetical protein n=1 Tax=Paraburkholderia sp. MM5477-R1 TaxID=2991062 RepID=UPI003D21F553
MGVFAHADQSERHFVTAGSNRLAIGVSFTIHYPLSVAGSRAVCVRCHFGRVSPSHGGDLIQRFLNEAEGRCRVSP